MCSEGKQFVFFVFVPIAVVFEQDVTCCSLGSSCSAVVAELSIVLHYGSNKCIYKGLWFSLETAQDVLEIALRKKSLKLGLISLGTTRSKCWMSYPQRLFLAWTGY